jgi:hypothetical protein
VTKLTKKKEKPQKEQPPQKEEQPQTEEPQEKIEIKEPQPLLKSLIYPFEVLFSPLKAFKKIAQYPDIKGLVTVVGLVLLASAGLQSFWASKIFLTINGQPTSLIATDYFSNFLLQGLMQSVLIFAFNWLIFAGALLLIASVLGAKGGGWRPFFILVGYAFSVFIVRTAITAALVSTLPQLSFSFSVWPPASEADVTLAQDQISAVWGPTFAFQAGAYFNLIIDAWLVILGAIAVRAYREVAWSKAATISVTAYLVYFTLRLFLGF